jgi:hypothetical protein
MSALFKSPPPPPAPIPPPPMPDPYSPSALNSAKTAAAARAGRSSTILSNSANRGTLPQGTLASGFVGVPYSSASLGGGK